LSTHGIYGISSYDARVRYEPRLHLVDRFEPERLPACPSCQAKLPGRWESEIWVEVPIDRRWVAFYRVVVKQGEPIVAEVRVLPSEPGQDPGRWSGSADAVDAAVPARALRALRLSDPGELFPKIVANLSRRHGDAATARILGRHGLEPDQQIHPRRPGRAGRTDEYYVRWAAAYIERVAAGSRHPIKDLAADPPVQIEGVTRRVRIIDATVRDILLHARQRRLLTNPSQGKAGGTLTAKAIKILDGMSEPSPRAPRQTPRPPQVRAKG
jgi:hypothetical protein